MPRVRGRGPLAHNRRVRKRGGLGYTLAAPEVSIRIARVGLSRGCGVKPVRSRSSCRPEKQHDALSGSPPFFTAHVLVGMCDAAVSPGKQMSLEVPERPRVWASTLIHGSTLPGSENINPRILESFGKLGKDDFTRRTHFFGGRYENLYLERARIPEVDLVLGYVEACARRILGYGSHPLRMGFWFNAQGPGQSTTEHTHEENDELLSGVYYVTAPKQSGDLVLLDGVLVTHVTPTAGLLLFFPPSLAHRVEVNQSAYQRLSIAFNVGPAISED